MTLVAEFSVTTPILEDTRLSFPHISLEMVSLYLTEDGQVKLVLWVEGDGEEEFFMEMQHDMTVDDVEVLAHLDDDSRILCSVVLTEEASKMTSYSQVVESDVVWISVVMQGDRGRWLVRIHDRDRLSRFVRGIRDENNESIQLVSLYDDAEMKRGERGRVEVSVPQLDALSTAYEMGYFDNPRRASLDQVGDQLGISSGAVSGRIRRAVRTLVRETVE